MKQGEQMKAKLVSVTESEGKPIWFRTYEFECIDCGKHFTRHRFDSRTNPYCPICHRKHENERQRERIETKKQMAINEVLDKISAEITEKAFTEEIFDEDVFRSTYTESMTREEAECESVIETEIVKLSDILEIIEKYKGDKAK